MNNISVYNSEGAKQDSLQIDFGVDKQNANLKNFACAINALRQNWRQGTVSCKGRSDVAFSGKKPWKQKGTGRARAGSLRSPLWRKGGVTFGPSPRVRKLSINRKQGKLALRDLFHSFLFSPEDKKRLICLDSSLGEASKPNTKGAFNILKKLGIGSKKIALFLPFQDEMTLLSFRNIEKVNVFYFDQPNVFDLSNCNCWVFLKKDLDLFKKMVSRWS